MENKEEHLKQIDVLAIAKEMKKHKKQYLIALPVTFCSSSACQGIIQVRQNWLRKYQASVRVH